MGLFQDFWDKIKERKTSLSNNDELDDDKTRDKYLRSLRRQRRVQMEEIEKEELKKKIKEFQKDRMRKHLYGIKDNASNKNDSLIKSTNLKKNVNILKEHNLMLKREGKSNTQKTSNVFMSKHKL